MKQYRIEQADAGTAEDAVGEPYKWLCTWLYEGDELICEEEWINHGDGWNWENTLEGEEQDGICTRLFGGDDTAGGFDEALDKVWNGESVNMER